MKKIKQYLFLIALICLLTFTSKAQNAKYQFDNNFPEGISTNNSSKSGLSIRHGINTISIDNVSFNDISGQIISMSGLFLSNEAGKPNLPVISSHIAIPKGAEVSFTIKNSKTKTLKDIDILPAAEPQLDNDNSPTKHIKDNNIYDKNSFFPENQVVISDKMYIRDIEVVMLSITPFQYNPITKELIVTYDMEIEVNFKGGDRNIGDVRYRNSAWEQIIQDMIINNDILDKVDYQKFIKDAIDRNAEGCEYLIICPDNEEMLQLADSLKLFRNQQGILTKVVNIAECGGNDEDAIKNYIHNAYSNWEIPPSAVLLFGDHDTDGTKGIVSHVMYNHIDESYNPYISDNIYGDVNNDHLPDIVIARITGRDYDEMYHMINKNLSYERQPPTNFHFYDKPITAMGYQLERWFQLCSEVVGGFWRNALGKHPTRQNAIYEGTPGSRWSTYEMTNAVVNYFGPTSLDYIPTTMSHLTEWDANSTSVNEAINQGAFLIQHRDHGEKELWGEPSYSISAIKKLTNKDLTFVMSNNCLTGKFDYGGSDGCFAEAFHRHQYGALGLIAATQVSYSFVNDIYVWGVYDNMWPDFMPNYGTEHPSNFILPSYGNASGKYFLRQSSWVYGDYTKEITYYLFHHHGDAYMNLYTEMPQHLEISSLPVIKENSSEYTIKADKDATICLSANGEIIGLGIATGDNQIINITPQQRNTEIVLTVTKQNYYRHTEIIKVIPSTGPYLIFDDCVLNDENNNNQADFNEMSELNIALHNVGTEAISNVNVTLHSDSPYVEILNNNNTFGNINVNEIISLENTFKIKIKDNVLDQTKIYFNMEMTSGDMHYTDRFYITAMAPVMFASEKSMTDLNDNHINGINKGESAKFTFKIKNEGHSNSDTIAVYYNIMAPFVKVEENPILIEGLSAFDSINITFIINVDSVDCPEGAVLRDIIEVKSGYYTYEDEAKTSLGNIIEDFEDEELNTSVRWANNGSRPWVRDDSESFEGEYSFKSSSDNTSSISRLMLGIETEYDGHISFYFKNPDENDNLNFSIDNDITESINSDEWQYIEYNLEAGNHLIQWTFKNDDDEGHAFIDLIKLPAAPVFILQGIEGDDFIVIDTAYSSSYTVDYFEDAEYFWSIEPEDAAVMTANNNSIELLWNNDFVGKNLLLSAYAKDEDGTSGNIVRKTINFSHVSIDEIESEDISIYPNPADNKINIELHDEQIESAQIEIIDTTGRSIYINNTSSNNEISIDVSNLSKGIYFIKLNTEDRQYIQKFIKN